MDALISPSRPIVVGCLLVVVDVVMFRLEEEEEDGDDDDVFVGGNGCFCE
jgi:hypothetical protein